MPPLFHRVRTRPMPPAGGPVAALAVHRTAIHYRDCASLTLVQREVPRRGGGIAHPTIILCLFYLCNNPPEIESLILVRPPLHKGVLVRCKLSSLRTSARRTALSESQGGHGCGVGAAISRPPGNDHHRRRIKRTAPRFPCRDRRPRRSFYAAAPRPPLTRRLAT